ncbi:glycosyl hydrolase family 28-related protein [Methanosphaerula palustris]|uniref:PKD domain containing protein n=1 Tax=Methanosphaerula palustris (strain ATCC BAA-1556 / DSM 19958 / E1-9c) TaxID=521011 RepID=B8GHR4_METPE|nr:glycosyl hydrolase family 28-related protein [Methanosphaerula palustris]ACL16669.1 PKD domain containing protein [Methanosphaerula palustris E1-9c]
MKKHLLILTLITAILLIGLVGSVSAARTPVAQFTASSIIGTAPLTVHFTDLSTGNPTAYAWKFGDGTTSSTKNPTHVYKTAGKYTVTETVQNRAGSTTIVKTGYITVVTPKTTVVPTTVATPVPTAIPTTVATPVPTAIPTTVATPVPTAIPTTVATIGPVTSAIEASAYANAAYTQGNARLAQMQQAYQAWVVPSRPDLVKIATNARTSGLKGDGVTDDTAALQSLLTNLPSGSTIYFPPGHYRIDGPISINKPFTLFGESGTVFDCEKATQYVFTLNAKGTSASPMTGMTITGIVFEGPGIETNPAMIDAYYLQNFHVSYVKFHNIGYAAIRVNTCTDVTIEKSIFDNVFQTGLGYGVSITDHSDLISIHDNFFVTKGRHSVTTGTSQTDLPVASYVQRVTVENNYFENTTEGAIDAHKPTTGPYVIRGNVMNNCVKGVELGSGTAQISDNVIVNCKGGVVLTNAYADPNNLPAKVDQIVDNTMINILYEAIDVDRTNVLIQGNVAKGTGNGGTGIYLEPYVPNVCNIDGNVIDSYARGFQASTPSSTISLVNNFLKSSGSYINF